MKYLIKVLFKVSIVYTQNYIYIFFCTFLNYTYFLSFCSFLPVFSQFFSSVLVKNIILPAKWPTVPLQHLRLLQFPYTSFERLIQSDVNLHHGKNLFGYLSGKPSSFFPLEIPSSYLRRAVLSLSIFPSPNLAAAERNIQMHLREFLPGPCEW